MLIAGCLRVVASTAFVTLSPDLVVGCWAIHDSDSCNTGPASWFQGYTVPQTASLEVPSAMGDQRNLHVQAGGHASATMHHPQRMCFLSRHRSVALVLV